MLTSAYSLSVAGYPSLSIPFEAPFVVTAPPVANPVWDPVVVVVCKRSDQHHLGVLESGKIMKRASLVHAFPATFCAKKHSNSIGSILARFGPTSWWMDDIKREELEKACRNEKNHKVRTKMVVVRMTRVLNMSVEETASIQVCCPT